MKNIFLVLLLLIKFLTIQAQNDSAIILNENFDNNKLGWIEEFTSSHYTSLKDGYLYILSRDTSKDRTSNFCQNTSFLWDLPRKYEIEVALTRLEGNRLANYGFLLQSATLNYKFSFSDDLVAELSETDDNKEEEIYLFTKKTKQKITIRNNPINLKVIIENRKYQYYVNNEFINEGELKAKSWQLLRPYVSSGSGIKVNYIRIKKVE